MSWRLASNQESDGVSLSCWQSLDRKTFQSKGTSFQTMERWKRNPGKWNWAPPLPVAVFAFTTKSRGFERTAVALRNHLVPAGNRRHHPAPSSLEVPLQWRSRSTIWIPVAFCSQTLHPFNNVDSTSWGSLWKQRLKKVKKRRALSPSYDFLWREEKTTCTLVFLSTEKEKTIATCKSQKEEVLVTCHRVTGVMALAFCHVTPKTRIIRLPYWPASYGTCLGLPFEAAFTLQQKPNRPHHSKSTPYTLSVKYTCFLQTATLFTFLLVHCLEKARRINSGDGLTLAETFDVIYINTFN